MLREWVVPAIAALSLAACSGAVSTPGAANEQAAGSTARQDAEPAAAGDASATTREDAAMPDPSVRSEVGASVPEAGEPDARGDASIAGSIRVGNRPPPAMRICAHPVDAGRPTCIASAEGARDYRIDVSPGRYVLLGWVAGGELRLVAHASQIRCIRAPCPPDALIEVSVAAGEQRTGINLTGGYIDVPEGWPRTPG